VIDTQILTSKAKVRIRRLGNENTAPALMIHGLGGSGHEWSRLSKILANDLDCLAPDLPGFGKSDALTTGDYSPKIYAQVLAEVVKSQFGEKQVHLFGNSHGGSVALHFAHQFPELTKSITFISPGLPDLLPRLSAAPVIIAAIPGVGEKMMEKFLSLPLAEQAKATIKQNFADRKYGEQMWLKEILSQIELRTDVKKVEVNILATLRALLATYFDLSASNPWNLAKSINKPSLFIYGAKDKLVHPRAAKKVTRYFSDAKVLLLPQGGHVSHIEHPELVREAFLKHLFPN